MPPKDEIHVFVTKTGHFRAKVTPLDKSLRYEITVGGRNWANQNKVGTVNRIRIIGKCQVLRDKLIKELDSVSQSPLAGV